MSDFSREHDLTSERLLGNLGAFRGVKWNTEVRHVPVTELIHLFYDSLFSHSRVPDIAAVVLRSFIAFMM